MVKAEKILIIFMILGVFLWGCMIYCIVQKEDLLVFVGFGIAAMVCLVGLLNMMMWKLEVSGNEITWRSTFGRKKKFQFDDITQCEKKGTVRVYVCGKKLFTIDSNIDDSEFMEDINKRGIPINDYWINQQMKK